MTLARLEQWVLRGLSAIAAAALLFMMVLTFVDVFMRYLFAAPINGSGDLIAFALALMVFSAFPLTTYEDAHISVGLLKDRLPPAAAWLERLLIFTISLAACALVAYELFVHGNDLARSQEATPVLGLPLAPLSYAMSFFAALASVAVVVLIVGHLRGAKARAGATPSDSLSSFEA